MSSESLETKAKNGGARAGAAAGDALQQVEDAVDAATDRIAESAAKARAVLTEAADRASDAYGELRGRAEELADTVDPFVKARPYAALAVAGLLGMVIGVLFFGRGPRVIYIRPTHS
jgi:ElaB/YqjD/DUF883 family membrane-anchored ribosome-binding protein